MTNQGLIAFLTFFSYNEENVRRRGFMNKKFLNRTWRSVSAALLAISFAVSLPAAAEEEPKAPSSLLMRSETDWESETELESESNSIYSDYEAFLIEQLYETNTSLTLLAGKSTWMDSDVLEEDRVALCADLLSFFEETKNNDAISPEELSENITFYYESGFSASIFDLAAFYIGADLDIYKSCISQAATAYMLNEYHRNEEAAFILDYQLFDAAIYYKNDWYGDRTDDERIALADRLLEAFRAMQLETGDYNGNTLAQEINDKYDLDAGDSVLYLALECCGAEEFFLNIINAVDNMVLGM